VKTLRSIHPNAGLEAWYRKRLQREIAEMNKSVQWWVGAAYRKQEPAIELAADAAPADVLEKVLASLRKRWGKRFDKLGEELAEKFAKRAGATTDDAVEAAMRAAGMRVKFQASKAQRDQIAATIHDNVSLIRTIPEKYFGDVEGAVYRSVTAGRDLGGLTDELQKTYGITQRRARNIARQQNNSASASLNRTRQLDLGIEEAEWVHGGGGKIDRASHVKAGRDKVIYNVALGWLDPATGKRIWPGSEIGCRCRSRSVINLPKFTAEAA
jgi:uncharacterized protein with gpF-like domain